MHGGSNGSGGVGDGARPLGAGPVGGDPARTAEAARSPEAVRAPVTLRTLRAMAERGEAFACLACYDATTARWLDRAGVHVLLAGDSAAEVVLGLPRTTHMPLEVSIALTAAVRRGAARAHVMADMPFMSYQASADEAMRNAGRFMTDGLADSVKLEADASLAPLVDRMTRAGIPVCAHVGSRPQTAALTGGYSSAGRTGAEARRILDDAAALEAAGAVLMLVEAVPEEVAGELVARAGVPVIGIGAGTSCHGQILVVNDLLGLSDHPPRFAEPVAALGPAIEAAGAEWVRRVSARVIGGRGYTMQPGERVDGAGAGMGLGAGSGVGAGDSGLARKESARNPNANR